MSVIFQTARFAPVTAAHLQPELLRPPVNNATGIASIGSISATGSAHRVYYVSTTGSDSNSGTQSSPFATIAHADSVLGPGDIVYVQPGTYTISGGFTTNASGTSTSRITFISSTPHAAILSGTSGGNQVPVWTSNGAYVTIQGFTITGPTFTEGIYVTSGHGVAATNVIVQGCVVHDICTNASTYSLAISSTDGASGILFDDYLTNYGTGGEGGQILGNLVYNIGEQGQTDTLVHGLYMAQTGATIANNVVYNCTGSGCSLWHSATSVNIMYNTFDATNGDGIDVGADSSGGFTANNCNVGGNIVTNCKYGIIENGSTGTNNKYFNNLIYNCSTANFSLQNGLTATGTVTSNPNYANASGHDYHLTAGSPAIGAGPSTDAPSTDYDGNPRPTPSTNSYDIGAYQYTSGGASGTASIGPISATGQATQTYVATGLASIGPIAAIGQAAQTDVATGLASIGSLKAIGSIPINAVGVAILGSISAAGSAALTDVATGLASIGPIAAAGQTIQTDVATGLASIGSLKAIGSIPINAVGTASIGQISAAGQATLTDVAQALASIGPVAAAGQATETNVATGVASIGPVKAVGQAVMTMAASGTASIGQISASGTLTSAGQAFGLATIGPIATSGQAAQTDAATGTASIGSIKAVGSAALTDAANGVASIGPIAATGSTTVANAATGLASIGPVKAAGTISQTMTGAGLASIGPIAATGVAGGEAVGLATIGSIAAVGIATQRMNAAGVASLGSIAVSGQALNSNGIAGLASLAAISAAGTISQINVVSGTASIGSFTAQAFTVPPISAVGTATLPSFTVAAAVGLTRFRTATAPSTQRNSSAPQRSGTATAPLVQRNSSAPQRGRQASARSIARSTSSYGGW